MNIETLQREIMILKETMVVQGRQLIELKEQLADEKLTTSFLLTMIQKKISLIESTLPINA